MNKETERKFQKALMITSWTLGGIAILVFLYAIFVRL